MGTNNSFFLVNVLNNIMSWFTVQLSDEDRCRTGLANRYVSHDLTTSNSTKNQPRMTTGAAVQENSLSNFNLYIVHSTVLYLQYVQYVRLRTYGRISKIETIIPNCSSLTNAFYSL